MNDADRNGHGVAAGADVHYRRSGAVALPDPAIRRSCVGVCRLAGDPVFDGGSIICVSDNAQQGGFGVWGHIRCSSAVEQAYSLLKMPISRSIFVLIFMNPSSRHIQITKTTAQKRISVSIGGLSWGFSILSPFISLFGAASPSLSGDAARLSSRLIDE